MSPDFEKANEIYFRLGIIYKQQQKFNQSLECFKYIVNDPPRPLTEEDIYFQIGHVHEQQKDVSGVPSQDRGRTRRADRDTKSSTRPKLPIGGCSIRTPTTPRSYSSSGGCTTSRAAAMRARRRRLNTWRSLSALVS